MVDVTGGPPMSEADWAGLFKSWFLELANFRLRQITWADIDQHRDYIESLLGTVTATTIHQRLRDEHKLQVPISAFRRWAHATLPDKVKRSQVTVLPEDIEPGEEAQIDYGFLWQWINRHTSTRHRIWAFVSATGPKPSSAGMPRQVKRSRCIRRQLASPTTTTSTSTSWPPTGPPARTGSSAKS